VGQLTQPIAHAVEAGTLPTLEFLDLAGATTSDIVRAVDSRLDGHLIFGVGNIHGSGEGLVTHFTGKPWEG